MGSDVCYDPSSNYGPQFTDAYGSLNAFYSIANGAIDNVQSDISASKKMELYFAMDMNTGYGNGDIIDATTNQVGLYVLQGIGAAILILMIVVAIFFTGCIRCCRRCTRGYSSKPSKVEQLFSLTILFLVYVVCFAFILTGTIIFGQSVANFSNAINAESENSAQCLRQATYNTETNGKNDLMRAYNNYIVTQLASLPNGTDRQAQSFISDWLRYSGIGSIDPSNEAFLNMTLVEAIGSGNIAKDQLLSLRNNPQMQDSKAQNEINANIDMINACLSAAQQILNLIPAIIAENIRVYNQSQTTQYILEGQLYGIDSRLLFRLSNAQANVEGTTLSVAGAGKHSARWSAQLYTTLLTKMEAAYNWGGFNDIKGTAVGLIAGPSALALLFILLAMLTCLYYLIGIFLPIAECGNYGRVGAHILRGSSYALMWLGAASIIVSSALFWYAYVYAGTCYNMYDEVNRMQFYSDVQNEGVSVLRFNGQYVYTSYGNFLNQLQSHPTVWSSLDSPSSLLTVSQFVNFVNASGANTDVDNIFAATSLSGNFSVDLFNQYNTQYWALNNSAVNFDANRNTPSGYLPYCTSINRTATSPATSAMFSFSFDLDFSEANALDEDTRLALLSSDKQAVIQAQLDSSADNFYVSWFQATIISALSNFLNNVQQTSYPSRPVYYNYANSGNLLCSYIRSPLNGTWAAAGMVALFWIPASICLWFTSNLLYRLHKRKSEQVFVEPVRPQPVVETQMAASTVVVTPVVTSPPPIVAFTTEQPIVTPVMAMAVHPPMASTAAPAMYPVIPDDSLAIIEGL